MRLNMEFRFSAAHQLPAHGGLCSRPHGHNYRFEVVLEGKPDPASGMIIDFSDLERIVKTTVLDKVDHDDLNLFLDNPTAENIAVWFWELLKEPLPQLAQIQLWEVEGCSVTYTGD